MKQIKLKQIILLFILSVLGIQVNAQYCASSAANGEFEYISKVALGSIDNESGSNLYSDYTASVSTDLYIGESYPLEITTEQYYVVDNIACWIDWNQDQVFESNEKITLNYSGTPSGQATATATVIPPADAVAGTTRMRILLVSDETASPCLDFTYGEVEDYSVHLMKIDTPPQANFSANKRIIYVGESVEFTDLSTLAPTSWNWSISPSTVSFIEGTDANSQNPVLTFNQSGNYSVTLKATNSIGTDDTVMVDYIKVKDFSKPRNVKATTEGKHVNLTWDAPNLPGTYQYVSFDDAGYILNPGPQRATRYSANDFNFTYPVTVTKVSGVFYQSSEDPWDDASFKFRIYDKDTSTILYESGVIEAQHNKEVIHELSSPLTLNNDFFVAIIPVSSSFYPSNLGKKVSPYSTHTYAGEPGSWWQFTDETTAYELASSIYISSDKGQDTKCSFYNSLEKNNTKEQVSFTLSGYKIYRNGVLIKQIDDPSIKSYVDYQLNNGNYEYYLKALYSPYGESPESDTVSVTVDNTNPEMMLIYNNNELVSGSQISLENNVMLDSTKSLTFGIYNEGQSDLLIDSITIDNSEFHIVNMPSSTIIGNDTSYFTVEFTPQTNGVKIASVKVYNNDSNENPYRYTIKGVGGLDQWTWMLYMLEDNTGLSGGKDINEWEVNGSLKGQVNYLVFYDSDDDSKDGIYYVKKDSAGFNYTMVSEKVSSQFGIDPHMNDPETLKKFLLWVKNHYPAQHYGLTMWDHGSGIFKKSAAENGIQKDFVGGMKLWEMSKAVKTFVDSAQHKIDVIGFDVCLLGQFETAYQFKDLADYVIASELTEPGDGWDYRAAFEPMSKNPDISPEQIAANITNTYVESYEPGGWQNRQASTQAATSISVLNNDFVPVFNNFADLLGDLCYDYKSEISKARYGAWAAISVQSNSEVNPDHRDLGGFLKSLSENQNLPSVLTESAQSTLEKYNQMVIAEGHTESITDGATGLKIWMPETMSTEGYDNTYYNTPSDYLTISNTKWDEYLKKYENPVNTKSPKAEFFITDSVEKGMTVQLINRSYYGPTGYTWEITPSTFEYVNGTNENSETPEILFTENGKYTISLTVTNSYGSDVNTQNNCIEVVDPDLGSAGQLSYSQDNNIVTLNWSTLGGTPVLDQGFENLDSFPPNGWSIMSNDNLDGTGLTQVEEGANTWGWCDENTFKDQNGNPDPQYIHSGSYSAAIGYTAGQSGDPFNWLITPEITVRNGDQLSFWLWYASDDSYYTDFDVMIYADNQWASLVHYTDGSGVNLYNEQVVLPLTQYENKTVKIAFVYQYTDGYQLAIDDIMVNNNSSSKLGGVNKTNKLVKELPVFTKKAKEAKTNSDHIVKCVNIYRNNVKIGKVDSLTKTSYTDTINANGAYSYYITLEYSEPEGESSPSNTVNVSVNNLTGINHMAGNILMMYPNPASDYVQINLPDGIYEGDIQIINLSGKIILEKQIDNTHPKIDVSAVKQGIYLVKLMNNNDVYTNKLIIQ